MCRVKVAIVGGAGGAGASAVFNLLLTGNPLDIAVVDSRDEMVTSHLMDLDQVLEQSPGAALTRGGDDDVRAADVVVITAAAPLTVNTSRLIYLDDNARIVDGVADLLPPSWPGVIVIVTNPIDPLVTRFQQRTGLDRRRVLGYTINDSLRLRTGLAKAFGAPPGAVAAWVVGEHGDACVPLLDRVSVAGVPRAPTETEAAAAVEYLRTWYVRHVALDSGRSSTWTTGLGVARMVSAIANGAGDLWPASLVLAGEYGIDGVAVTVPVTLGRGGAEAIHQWELTPDQMSALRASAELVRRLVDRCTGQPAS
jgi:malate/lactate dehydrogenase